MPKLKTHKSIAKRITVTRTGKVKQRRGGQSHYNTRLSGEGLQKKRRDVTVAKTETRNLRRLLPYS